MSKEKKVDMHIHTNASDGTWDLDHLIKNIKDNDIYYFSITDHDNIDNTKLFFKNDYNFKHKFFPGVEISCTFDNTEFHIVSYNFDIYDKDLNLLLKNNSEIRKNYNRQIIIFFEKKFDIELINKYFDYKNDKSRGGWKSLNFLLDNKLIDSLNDFFIQIIEMDEKMIFPSPKKITETIHNAGGFNFLAHPASYYNGELLDFDFLDEWIEMGIDGIEAYSPYLKDIKDAKYYKEYCNINDLMISAGSDCHGEFIKERIIGKPEVYLNDIIIDKLLR